MLCFPPTSGDAADGGKVTYADPTGEDNQSWVVEKVTTEHEHEPVVMIKNKHSGKAMAHQG